MLLLKRIHRRFYPMCNILKDISEKILSLKITIGLSLCSLFPILKLVYLVTRQLPLTNKEATTTTTKYLNFFVHYEYSTKIPNIFKNLKLNRR